MLGRFIERCNSRPPRLIKETNMPICSISSLEFITRSNLCELDIFFGLVYDRIIIIVNFIHGLVCILFCCLGGGWILLWLF